MKMTDLCELVTFAAASARSSCGSARPAAPSAPIWRKPRRCSGRRGRLMAGHSGEQVGERRRFSTGIIPRRPRKGDGFLVVLAAYRERGLGDGAGVRLLQPASAPAFSYISA